MIKISNKKNVLNFWIFKIRLLCGDKTELKQVQEPSKCVYEFDLITPAACWIKIFLKKIFLFN